MQLEILSSNKNKNNPRLYGYPLDRFAQCPTGDFLCTLCGMVAREPLECYACGRLFCTLCLFSRERDSEGNGFNASCPYCGQKEKPKRPSKVLMRIINEMKIFCTYKTNGCGESMSICKIQNHEQLCVFRKVRCENSKYCRNAGLAKDFLQTNHVSIKSLGFACSKKCKKILGFENRICNKKINEALGKYYKLLQKIGESSDIINV